MLLLRAIIFAAACRAALAAHDDGGSGVGDPEYYEAATAPEPTANEAWLTEWLPAVAGATAALGFLTVAWRRRRAAVVARDAPPRLVVTDLL